MARTRSVHRPRDRGAAAVELALVLPIFLILIFGLIQYGWLFYQVQETSFAVREGARVAAVGTQNSAGVATLVTSKIPSASSTPSVTVCWEAGALGEVGDQIIVTASHTATDFNFPFVPFRNALSISQTATTRTENVTGNSDYNC